MSTLPGKLPPIVTGRLAGGLLAAARDLPTDYDNWRQGITFTPNCSVPNALTFCVDPEDATDKVIDSLADPVVFEPFLVYHARECSTWIDSDELLDLARRGLETTISGSYARELQTSATSDSLNSVAVDITPLDGLDPLPSNIVNTMSGLTMAALECGITDLVFHGNIRLLPYLLNLDLVEWDEASGTWRVGGGPWPFILDNYGPIGPDDLEEAEDGTTSWIYVSGPVEVALGPELDLSGTDVRVNGQTELVERLGILRFDPCCVRAALADINDVVEA